MSETSQVNGEPALRYPASLTLIRHAQSKYNELKGISTKWDSFRVFHERFKAEFYSNAKERIVRPDLALEVVRKRWPSPELYELAVAFYEQIHELMQGVSDSETPITDKGLQQATETGRHIAEHVPKPDIIYLSPYLRTRQTLEAILAGAPADWRDVQKWENEPVREQEHGMNTVFNDWRLSYVFDPMEMLHSVKQGEYDYRYRGGENRYDVRDRASRFIGRLRRKHEGENVLVVSHHLTILATLGELLHWTREEFLDWDENRKPANCGVTILRREEGVSRTGKDLLILGEGGYSRKLYTE